MSAPPRPPSRPRGPGDFILWILCGLAVGGCNGVIWTLPDGDAETGIDGATATDGVHDDAMPPPVDTSGVAPGAPWPSCVNGQCSEPWLHCNGNGTSGNGTSGNGTSGSGTASGTPNGTPSGTSNGAPSGTPSGTNASANANLCVPCVHGNNSMQCPTDAPHSWLSVCDLVAGDSFENQCVECVDQIDCGVNEVCNAHQCISVCQNGLSCPKSSANTCDRTRSICVSCLSSGDCPSGESCNIDTGRCGECASDGDCPPFKPKCDVRDNECVECITSADCNGAVCDPQTQTCSNSKM